jgi:hypothetical protein
LWPKGVECLEDLPFEFVGALQHAVTVLSWMRNLGKDELPPQWMWPFHDELDKWFEEVEIARKAKYGISDDDDDDDSGGGLTANELSRGRG